MNNVVFLCIIEPVKNILEIVFTTLYKLSLNIHFSLFGLSFVVFMITAPFYRLINQSNRADEKKRSYISCWEAHIRKHFKGDEKALMLRFFYDQAGYSQLSSIKGLFPLMLQIPFFIAAWLMLSEQQVVKSSLFTEADNLIHAGSTSIHLLPIIMTVISIVSAVVYNGIRKERNTGEKLQAYLLPLVFLVLLYDRPAALVLYWTYNNIFSLLRNIAERFDLETKFRKFMCIPAYILGMYVYSLVVYSVCYSNKLEEDQMLNSVISSVILISYNVPLLVYKLAKEKGKTKKDDKYACEFGKSSFILIEELILLLFTAVYPGLEVIAASTTEFPIVSVSDVFQILTYPFLVSAGFFLIWANLVFVLLKGENRNRLGKVLLLLIVVMFFDHFFWSNDNGLLMANVRYESIPEYKAGLVILSIACLFILIISGCYLCSKAVKIPIIMVRIAFVAVLIMSTWKMYTIIGTINSEELKSASEDAKSGEAVFQFSREGKNVLLIMLDRAVGAYVPYIFEEQPEIKGEFDGFVWYPNTVSFGGHTNFGAPPIFGGYEYTPLMMTEQSGRSMKEKHIEALRVLPELFAQNDWVVNLADLPYADYTEESSMSEFNKMDGISGYDLERRYAGRYYVSPEDKNDYGEAFAEYSMYKLAPYFLQSFIYNDLHVDINADMGEQGFIKSYSVLDELPKLTGIKDNETGCLSIINNHITHESHSLQMPGYEYELGMKVDNSAVALPDILETDGGILKLKEPFQRNNFNVNILAFKKLGKWLDMLKSEGVYDNTRIIIVSDHGYPLGMIDEFIINDELDIQRFNCLLMFKDYDSHGFTTNMDFMTNADVPYMATHGIIQNVVNPFTSNAITKVGSDKKYADITLSSHFRLTNGNTYDTSDAPWYRVKKDIFDEDNWQKITE